MSGGSYNGTPLLPPAFNPGNIQFPLERSVATTNETTTNISYVYPPALPAYPSMGTLTVPRKRKRTPDSYTEFGSPLYLFPDPYPCGVTPYLTNEYFPLSSQSVPMPLNNPHPYGVAPYLTNGYLPLSSQTVPMPLHLNNVTNISASENPYLLSNAAYPPPIQPGTWDKPNIAESRPIAPYEFHLLS